MTGVCVNDGKRRALWILGSRVRGNDVGFGAGMTEGLAQE